MKRIMLWCLAFYFLFSLIPVSAQTIVIMRHGEKPWLGIGQLNCKGLNRGLLLAKTLVNKYGKPDSIFAPNPNSKVVDPGGIHFYVRPLVTILPLATQLNLPVNTAFGYKDISALAEELVSEPHHQSVIFVAWEHYQAYLLAKKILSLTGGNTWDVPFWFQWDFDSLYVINIDWQTKPARINFFHDYEELNGQSDTCPAMHSAALNPPSQKARSASKTQRFIFIPEAEAALPEKGNLSCAGINRALHLSQRLISLFTSIDKFYAAAPIQQIYDEKGAGYFYQRALLTLEPATIFAGKPMYSPFGYRDTDAMANELFDKAFYDKTIAIAWSRETFSGLVGNVYQRLGGNILEIPLTPPDHDSLYVITIDREGSEVTKSQFRIMNEGLDNQSGECPAAI